MIQHGIFPQWLCDYAFQSDKPEVCHLVLTSEWPTRPKFTVQVDCNLQLQSQLSMKSITLTVFYHSPSVSFLMVTRLGFGWRCGFALSCRGCFGVICCETCCEVGSFQPVHHIARAQYSPRGCLRLLPEKALMAGLGLVWPGKSHCFGCRSNEIAACNAACI